MTLKDTEQDGTTISPFDALEALEHFTEQDGTTISPFDTLETLEHFAEHIRILEIIISYLLAKENQIIINKQEYEKTRVTYPGTWIFKLNKDMIVGTKFVDQ